MFDTYDEFDAKTTHNAWNDQFVFFNWLNECVQNEQIFEFATTKKI